MTGEITLRGRVLPIGGLKSKILAAHLAGARMVVIPRKNEKDLRDIPDEIRKQIKLVLGRLDGPGPRDGAPAAAEAAAGAPKAPARDAEPAKEPETETPIRAPELPAGPADAWCVSG